jgi:hypothetical protein
MTWRDLSQQAMNAMMGGDDTRAIGLWSQSVMLIEKGDAPPIAEQALVYHYLGKSLSGTDLQTAIKHLTTAEAIMIECEPGNHALKQIKYDLGEALCKAGRSDEATPRLRYAKDIVVEPLPECLSGTQKEALSNRATIKFLQKHGLAKELSAKEIKRIKKDMYCLDCDDEEMNIFDLLWCYYNTDERVDADRVACFEDADDMDDWDRTLAVFNAILGEDLFSADDLVNVGEGDNPDLFLVIDRDEEGPVGVNLRECPLVDIYNTALKHAEDPRRIVTLSSYDDREMFMATTVETAAAIFLGGAGQIFEDLPKEIEPMDPELYRLT